MGNRRLSALLAIPIFACAEPLPRIEHPDELADAAFFTTVAEAEKALRTTFDRQPVRYAAATMEGVGWGLPGLECGNAELESFAKVAIDGVDAAEARRIHRLFERHNAALLPRLPSHWRCTSAPDSERAAAGVNQGLSGS